MMRCFPLPKAIETIQETDINLPNTIANASHPDLSNHPITQWLATHQHTEFNLSILQRNALANLIPLLLCGEQSAVHVFNHEYRRLEESTNQPMSSHDTHSRNNQLAMQNLQRIEADERLHEQALQFILQTLPKSNDQHKIKRKAQQFYANIQQYSASVAQHFWLISQLDACVCILMNSVARSSIKDSPLAQLFNLIKKDEARHVKIAKQYSLLLAQNTPTQVLGAKGQVQHQLVQLLKTQSSAFEHLKIDSNTLFNAILNLSTSSRAA
jgi:hypothetical protein